MASTPLLLQLGALARRSGLLAQQHGFASAAPWASTLISGPQSCAWQPSGSDPSVPACTAWRRATASGTPPLSWPQQLAVRLFSTNVVAVSLSNLRDNDNAVRKRIRVGRGNSSRKGNYCGRGMNGQNSRGRGAHMLYDGGQLGLLKFPVTRERPPYEVLYTQLGLGKLVEYAQLGLLKTNKVITMKDLLDVGCLSRVKYGVLLYGKVPVHFPIHIQVTACDDETKKIIEAAGGSVTRVYYEEEGLKALLHPSIFTQKKVPLPLPAHSWHPRYNGKFDGIGQLPPVTRLPASLPPPPASSSQQQVSA